MVENYVNKIARAVRELDKNEHPLSHYMAYGWEGLRKAGYTAKRLTKTQDNQNYELQSIVESSTHICN